MSHEEYRRVGAGLFRMFSAWRRSASVPQETQLDGAATGFVQRAVRLRHEGSLDGLRALATEALTAIPDDLRQLVDVAIQMRDASLFDEAKSILAHINMRNPRTGYGHYELAVMHLHKGEHLQGLLAIEQLRAYMPSDLRGHILAARLMIALGGHAEAAAAMRQAQGIDPGCDDLRWLSEFSDFIAAHPFGMAQYLAHRAEGSERYLNATGVASKIRDAIAGRRGFAMIRLGDGEGAFSRISAEDESRYANLYRRNREDRARVWFNGQIDLEASGFNAVALGLRNVIQQADIVGLPYASWIEHEFRIQSPTGISTLINALRVSALPGVDVGQNFCRQTVHIELHQHGAIAEFIRSQDRIGLISCHPALPDVMKAHFGLSDVTFYKIPGEKLFEDRIGQDASAGIHFPNRFEAIMGALAQPLDGMLFLVAGGILGKFYCARIKQSGGIALDIGSLVDAWIGVDTRPGYDSLGANLA